LRKVANRQTDGRTPGITLTSLTEVTKKVQESSACAVVLAATGGGYVSATGIQSSESGTAVPSHASTYAEFEGDALLKIQPMLFN